MNFNPLFSTKECYRDDDLTRCLEDDLQSFGVDLSNRAMVNHTHSQYALKSLQGVADDGTCEYSLTKAKGDDCLTALANLPLGMHTVYSQSGVIKRLTVYDTKLVGHADNVQAPRDDVVLRAVYEW